MLTTLIVVIILPYIQTWNHYGVYLKLICYMLIISQFFKYSKKYSFLNVNHTSIDFKKRGGGEEKRTELTLLLLPTQGDLERGPQLISLTVFKSFLMAHPHLQGKWSPVTCKKDREQLRYSE